MIVPRGFDIELARRVQRRLAERVVQIPLRDVQYVVGVDVAYKGDVAFSAAVVYSVNEGRPLEYGCSINKVVFPYVPTLLSFRELMPIVRALRKIKTKFDVVLVDGQGIAHPYKLGLAAHLGVALGIASIGVAKSKLYGEIRGNLIQDPRTGEVIGALVICRRPLYVSVGNMVTLDDAVNIVRSLCKTSSMPEPLLLAHNKANELKRRQPAEFDRWGEAPC